MDYLFLFGDFRTAYSDMAAGCAEKTGQILILLESDLPAGYLLTDREPGQCTVLYGYTVPDRRNRGIFSELLAAVISGSDCSVRLSITENKECFPAVKHVCEKAGLRHASSCIIFGGRSEDFENWEVYMARTGSKFCDILLRQGYRCISLAEADDSVTEALYDSGSSDFHNRLDVRPYLDHGAMRLDRSMSFLAVKDHTIAAYTLVRRPDPASAVFEHISAHEKYIGSGCILLPFARSMEKFRELECRRAVYAMYEDNSHANAFRKKLLGKVTSSQKRSHNFIR